MAGAGISMQITAVDHYNDLFIVDSVFPQHLVDCVLHTDWINLPWSPQQGQESWSRRRIHSEAVPWFSQWEQCLQDQWSDLADRLGKKLKNYQGTAWWVDLPGFTCSIHTDGEMPGAMQLTWIGAPLLGTTFYHYKDANTVRHQFDMQANSGYVMINSADPQGYRHLQWHGMLEPVPVNSYRLTSYTWLTELLSK